MGRYTKDTSEVIKPSYGPSPSEIADRIKNHPFIIELPPVPSSGGVSVISMYYNQNDPISKIAHLTAEEVNNLYTKIDEMVEIINSLLQKNVDLSLKINELVKLENERIREFRPYGTV